MKRDALFSGLLCLCLLVPAAEGPAEGKAPKRLPGQRAIVVDDRYSALRERPESRATLVQRLRRGRVVGLLGSVRNRDGERFHRIAVSRSRSGWIYDAAIVRPGNPLDASRLLSLIEETTDDYQRVMLLRLCQREFRRAPAIARAMPTLGERLAETLVRVAERLTLESRRRFGTAELPLRRTLFLGSASLDRYNRLGILFDYDQEKDELRWNREGK